MFLSVLASGLWCELDSSVNTLKAQRSNENPEILPAGGRQTDVPSAARATGRFELSHAPHALLAFCHVALHQLTQEVLCLHACETTK
jgi:hypothetical protein